MDIQFGWSLMAIVYMGLIIGILGTALYAFILLIKALKIYIKNNS